MRRARSRSNETGILADAMNEPSAFRQLGRGQADFPLRRLRRQGGISVLCANVAWLETHAWAQWEGRAMKAQLDEGTVIKASTGFWEQMLAMTLEQAPIRDRFCVGTRHLRGSVELGGVWMGRIEVRMTASLAYRATAAMLMQPMEEVGEADTLDATKEIANMIAGAIKSSLPRPCTMTVPDAAVESAAFCDISRTNDTLAVAFQHSDGEMMVRV
jgi:CheY-specific phosphatase CheX